MRPWNCGNVFDLRKRLWNGNARRIEKQRLQLKKTGSKLSTFALGKEMASKFEQKNITVTCKELRSTAGITGRLRSCRGCVVDCARIVE